MVIDIEKVNRDYGRQLYVVVLDIVKDYELAKDVMQESLIKIWRNQSKYDKSKAGLWAWMRAIVVRASLDQVRSKYYNSSKLDMYRFGNLSLNTDTIDFYTILDKLEPKYSFIIKEHCIKGFTQVQISETHNIPLGTVKTRLKIGLRELKLIYKD